MVVFAVAEAAQPAAVAPLSKPGTSRSSLTLMMPERMSFLCRPNKTVTLNGFCSDVCVCRPTETVQGAAVAPAGKAGAQHPRQSHLDGFLRDAAKAAAAFATTQTPRQQGPLQRHIKASAANQGFFGHYQAAHEQAARMRLSGGEGQVRTLPRPGGGGFWAVLARQPSRPCRCACLVGSIR